MVWLFKTRKKGGAKTKTQTTPKSIGRLDYRAVKIKTRARSCSSAKAKEQEIYLCSEAPLLPLDSCGCKGACPCTYTHYDDRRQYARREVDNGLPGSFYEKERRARNDRRKNDLPVETLELH